MTQLPITGILGTPLQDIGQKLNFIYSRFMYLKIFIDSTDGDLHQIYREAVKKHNQKIMENPDMVDAGFDLFTPKQRPESLFLDTNNLYKPHLLDFQVVCSALMITDLDISNNEEFFHNTGYDMRARSSLSGTNFRLANSIGTIDAGYRGHIMGKFDIVNKNENPLIIEKYVRLVQICAPGLLPILVKIVDTKEELGNTLRGEGGFGSTGR